MGTLVYSAGCSLDGYINDATGDFQWTAPTPEVFDFIVEQLERVELEMYGRRTYELMTVWETDPSFAEAGPRERDFTEWWMRTPKKVYSTTLPEEGIITRNAQLLRRFDPEEVRRFKEETTGEVTIFGPTLAAHAFEADLVDELQLYVIPVTVGGGTRLLPPKRLSLELRSERRFADGTLYLRYRIR